MGYWKWWFRRDGGTKLFFIYWIVCIIIGFSRMGYVVLSYPMPPEIFDFLILNMLISGHPGIYLLFAKAYHESAKSYKRYKKENPEIEISFPRMNPKKGKLIVLTVIGAILSLIYFSGFLIIFYTTPFELPSFSQFIFLTACGAFGLPLTIWSLMNLSELKLKEKQIVEKEG